MYFPIFRIYNIIKCRTAYNKHSTRFKLNAHLKNFTVINFLQCDYVGNFSHDAFLLAKNKPQPVPTSIIHAPPPTQQFGVSIQL